ILGKIINFCFKLLSKEGLLIIAHKNVKEHKSIASDWFCDWYFYPRNEQDMENILNEYLKEYKFTKEVIKDRTGHIFFANITKL
ncbi:MAG: hypothetical protein NC918_07475, partial [Candidatus Omnitrophica bacterium]|nr:hypothetical protein [Candidatus Omnitrophota bacterium]